MKKRFAALSMMSLLTIGALTSCGVKAKEVDNKQVIVTVGDKNYTADDLFAEYSQTTNGVSAYYNAIYDLLIRKSVTVTTQMTSIVNTRIDELTQQAKDNATTNGTTYKKELSTLLDNAGVDSISELREIYTLEEQKSEKEDQYYDDHKDELLLEYSKKKTPYHISHILVKLNDASSSLYDTQISANDAVSLAAVVDSLVDTNITFGQTAKEMSDDNEGTSSSANMFGDLGIMDQDTSFVSEFKYSLFAYDAFIRPTSDTFKAKDGYTSIAQELGLDKTFAFTEQVTLESVLGTVNEIPYEVVKFLGSLPTDDNPVPAGNQKTFDVIRNGETITKDYSASAYPRNVIFNQYFNDHGIGVITSDVATGNFKVVSGLSAKPVLCDEKGNPVLVSRASASYEGVHFMVINKSPFELNDEQFKKYYDTEIPSSKDDTHNTFVTAISSNRDTYKDRVDTIKNAVKSFDSYYSYRIYEDLLYKSKSVDANGTLTYELKDGIKIDDNIVRLVQSYIDGQRTNTDYTNEASTNKTLESYVQLLQLQAAQKNSKALSLSDIKALFAGTDQKIDDDFVLKYDKKAFVA